MLGTGLWNFLLPHHEMVLLGTFYLKPLDPDSVLVPVLMPVLVPAPASFTGSLLRRLHIAAPRDIGTRSFLGSPVAMIEFAISPCSLSIDACRAVKFSTRGS